MQYPDPGNFLDKNKVILYRKPAHVYTGSTLYTWPLVKSKKLLIKESEWISILFYFFFRIQSKHRHLNYNSIVRCISINDALFPFKLLAKDLHFKQRGQKGYKPSSHCSMHAWAMLDGWDALQSILPPFFFFVWRWNQHRRFSCHVVKRGKIDILLEIVE